MSVELQPLIWKNIEKTDSDDIWPKKIYAGALLFIQELNQYFLIGGNYNAYENERKNYELNNEIIRNANRKRKDEYDENEEDPIVKAEQMKLKYNTENLTLNYYKDNQIDIYNYQIEPEPHWYKVRGNGKPPKPRAFQQCVYLSPYIFLFGGVELSSKSESISNDEFYALNIKTYEWKQIINNIGPYHRTEFKWIKIGDNLAYLYGGVSAPSPKFYDDMWSFNFDGSDLFKPENKKQIIIDNLWTEINQKGNSPGKIKAYSMEFSNPYLYLFGGINNKKISNNNLFRFNLLTNTWEKLNTQGAPPSPRCYHEMALINNENMVVFGGIKGSINEIELINNDVYIYNIRENIWVSPVIGGIEPQPRIGFSLCCNYGYNKKGNSPYEIMLLGGCHKDAELNEKNKGFVKIFILTETDQNSKFFWTIKDIKYKEEEENDDNFLLQAEKNIYDYKEKISNLELDTRSKEIENEKMKNKINEYKKQFYQQHGFIDDQSQSLEDQINEQENQKNKMKENYEIDQQTTDLKIKLKFVMEKKTEKTLDFFNETSSIFINYYDAVSKIMNNDKPKGELEEVFPLDLNKIKETYTEKLKALKSKLEKYSQNENSIIAEFHRYMGFEKPLIEAFKNEIEKYKIDDNNN